MKNSGYYSLFGTLCVLFCTSAQDLAAARATTPRSATGIAQKETTCKRFVRWLKTLRDISCFFLVAGIEDDLRYRITLGAQFAQRSEPDIEDHINLINIFEEKLPLNTVEEGEAGVRHLRPPGRCMVAIAAFAPH